MNPREVFFGCWLIWNSKNSHTGHSFICQFFGQKKQYANCFEHLRLSCQKAKLDRNSHEDMNAVYPAMMYFQQICKHSYSAYVCPRGIHQHRVSLLIMNSHAPCLFKYLFIVLVLVGVKFYKQFGVRGHVSILDDLQCLFAIPNAAWCLYDYLVE